MPPVYKGKGPPKGKLPLKGKAPAKLRLKMAKKMKKLPAKQFLPSKPGMKTTRTGGGSEPRPQMPAVGSKSKSVSASNLKQKAVPYKRKK